MSVEERVRAHFDADARRFDAIYVEEKGAFARWVDSVWRGVVKRRLVVTLERLEPLAGLSVLDVGCGSGRFCLAYAQRGAMRVVGVDFASAMIELAKRHADALGVADRCEFRVGSFPEAVPEAGYDVASAIGFFDYVPDATSLVRAMREKTRSILVLSFPKALEWRVPMRRLRFLMLGCPLYLYSAAQVRKILSAAGITRYDWIALDRDYMVIAHLGERPS